MAKLLLKSKIKKFTNSDNKKQVAIVGYSGAAVDLKDMGIPDPLVYNLDGFSVHNNIPYYEEHKTLIGHTIENRKEDGELITIAEHSVDNNSSKSIYEAIQNGENYEASMGVEIDLEHVIFINSGTVEVNRQTFKAPIYVANKGTVDEMTATKSGRDSNTSIHKLSQEYEEGKDLLMKIKNSRLKVTNSDPSQEYLEGYKDHEFGKLLIDNAKTNKWDEDKFKAEVLKLENAAKKKDDPPQDFMYLLGYIDDPIGKTLIQNARTNKWDEDAFKAEIKKVEIENAKKLLDHKDPIYDPMFLLDYAGHPIGSTLIKNARENKWDQERMDREIEVVELKNSHPRLPGVHMKDGNKHSDDVFKARLARSLDISEKTILNNVSEDALNKADNQGMMGLKEGLVISANSNGGNYTGYSDVEPLAKHIKRLHIHNNFSTVDYPNLFHQVSKWKKDEIWELDAPQSPGLCKKDSSSNFQDQGRIKASGGKMWDGLNQEGKISHGAHGNEDKYITKLNTVAQIVTFKREDIINDDMGTIEDTLDLMLEGALMVPDYQFVNLWYNADTANVITESVLTLTGPNLTTAYNSVRIRNTTKTAPVNDKVVNGRFNTRWWLVVTTDLEEAAWDLIKQDRIVQNDVKGALGNVGDKNYWFNRLDIMVFDNLDNTTYHAGALATSWGLLPQRERYRPFYIRNLNNQTSPITENVDLPADMLGFGVRGYWDINEGYRPVENDLLQATFISTGAGS